MSPQTERMPDLFQASVAEEELINSSSHEKIRIIEERLRSNDPSVHIYTESLNLNGTAVRDSFEKYLGADALQSSHLKEALKTPLHLFFKKEDDAIELEKAKGAKKYFELGTFLHQCILEPTLFSRVIVEPNLPLSSTEGVEGLITFWEKLLQQQVDINNYILTTERLKDKTLDDGLSLEKIAGKKRYYEYLKEEAGIMPVSEEHFLKIRILKKHLDNYKDGIIYRLLKHSKRETSFYYTNENGTNLKVRPDALQFKENIGVDAVISVKSTACEDLQAFYYNAAKMHYDLSEGMYQEVISNVTGRKFDTTIMIMLQTVQPYAVALLIWDKDDIEVGKYKFHTGLSVAEKAIKNQDYSGYESFSDNSIGLIEMKLPIWNNKEVLPS